MKGKLPKGAMAIVCGSRNCSRTGKDFVFKTLDRLHPDFVIQGGADGVDKAAKMWAAKMGIPCSEVLALWGSYHAAAGPIRNGWMLRLKPQVVIAFPGGPGTANMVKQAKAAHIEVIEVEYVKAT